MDSYPLLKNAHKGFAYLSITLFAIRGVIMLADKRELLARKPVKIVPMVVDTLLLVCAIGLVVMGGWPLSSPWLQAKFVALIAYILLGVIALRAGKTKAIRTAAFFAGLLVVAYIVAVARTKLVIPL